MPSDLHVFLLRYQSFISILFYILSAIYLKGFRLVLCPTWEYDTQKGCKPLQRCASVTTQWPSHDRRQGGWHEHEQRGHPRSVILKREKWRLRPFSFGWVTAQLHDLWPGESRGARGHLSPSQETGEKRVSRDKFCFDCIFLFKYYTADGCINLLAF